VVQTSGIFGMLLRKSGFYWSRWGPSLLCSSLACHPVSSLEDALPPPSRPSPRPTAPAAGRWPDVLDVHLTAQLLTVSADTVYDLLQRGDLPGRKVGRKWLTTKTAVLKWLEQSATPRPTAAQETALARAIAHGDTAALVDAVRTGKARLGTKVQHAARSGRVV
jgi:excisionase family DNA binding protein